MTIGQEKSSSIRLQLHCNLLFIAVGGAPHTSGYIKGYLQPIYYVCVFLVLPTSLGGSLEVGKDGPLSCTCQDLCGGVVFTPSSTTFNTEEPLFNALPPNVPI